MASFRSKVRDWQHSVARRLSQLSTGLWATGGVCGAAVISCAERRRWIHQRLLLDAAELARGRQEREAAQTPRPTCGHWSAHSDSGLALSHPGVQRQSPLLFVQVDSKDNRKCLEPAAPRGSNLTFSFLFQTSLLPLSRFTHSTPYFISSSLWHHFFCRFLLNLPLPLLRVYKGSLLYGPDGERTLRQRLLTERNGNNK